MTYEYEGKTEKEAIEMAVADLNLERDQFDVEILETQKNSLFKKGYVKIRVHTFDDNENSFAASASTEKKLPFGEVVPKGEFEEKLIDFIKSKTASVKQKPFYHSDFLYISRDI